MNTCIFYLLLLIQLYKINADNFGIRTNQNGGYKLIVKNQTWLKSANTFIRSEFEQYDTDSKSLHLQNINQLNGSDILGAWMATSFQYSFNNKSDEIIMECRITKYDHLNAVRFTQVLFFEAILNLNLFSIHKVQLIYLKIFPYGLDNTAVPNTYHKVASAFPSFHIDKVDGLDIGYLSYGGMMGG